MVGRVVFCAMAVVVCRTPLSAQGDAVISAAAANQFDLASNGYSFLLREANSHDFFLLGELHGDNEIPSLIAKLWPEMWNQGYRQIAAEMSPWAAQQLEFVPTGKGPVVTGLWTKEQAGVAHAPAGPRTTVIWGCDMEEIQWQYLIRDLAALNPGDGNLQRMVALTAKGASRQLAPEMLSLLSSSHAMKDAAPNGISLRANLQATLEIERYRMSTTTRPLAQNRRELLMKQQFLEHYRQGDPGKVFLRFGQAHMFRGLDNDRGVSTLGNFIAEFAVTVNRTVFNVAAFGAGGQYWWNGSAVSADQRSDEPAFDWLASQAKFESTVFDMRPLRPLLHAIEKPTALEASLIYWADSYDALICFKNVTPLVPGR